MGNQYVYCVVSQRAGGLSIGVNLNPNKHCNFDCVYCEIDRSERQVGRRVHIPVVVGELEHLLQKIQSGNTKDLGYPALRSGLISFKEVALSGDGEPTLCPNFQQAVEAIVHLRSRSRLAFFKIVLITNASGLHFPQVKAGVDLLSPQDEVWAKLDAGTQAYLNAVNNTQVPLERILENILDLARRRPVVIQSLFPMIAGRTPPDSEIAAYVQCLKSLKDAGADIPLVQVYSAHRPAIDAACSHLPLQVLAQIARLIREGAGLHAEVF